MDQFSIPERMDPVSRVENQGRNTVSEDRRRRQTPNPSRPRNDREDADLPPDEEESSHNLDELA